MRKSLAGLLSAFAVVAAEAATLPSGYVAVDYIESTQGGGQYINTEYVHRENTKIVCEVNASSQMGSQPGSAAVFGACKGNQLANAFVFYAKDSFGAVCYQRDAQEDTGEGHAFPCDVRTTITCVRQLAMWSDSGDNKTIYIPMDKVEGGICPLLIFDKNTATDTGVKPEGSAAAMRLYSFKIYEDEALVHDFVPCVQEGTGKAGLYDVIGGGFHGNAGTGADFQRAMPSGYMAVEYIESTKGGGQYINTGYVPKTTTKVDCVVNVPDGQLSSHAVVFGAHSSSKVRNKNMSFFAWFNSGRITAYNRGTEEKVGGAFGYNSKVRLTCEGSKASWSSAEEQRQLGEIINPGEIQDGDSAYPLYIFALDEPNADNPGQPFGHTYLAMKLYSFKIYEGEKLERDFVPCIEKATGKMGLYDIVKFRFYGNAGNKEDFPRTLPHGFVSIDCIESTGLERIDTGYKCLSGTKIDCSIQVASSQPKDYSAVFGSRNRVYWTDSYEFHVRWDGKNEPIYLRNSEKKGGDAEDFPYDQRVALTCHGKTATWTWGGNSKTLTVDNEPCDCVNPLMIFDVNRDGYGGSSAEGNPCVMRLYSFRIFEGEAVKRNFVPCIEMATGKAGLYDIVEGHYHGNVGAGAFRHHVVDVPYWDPVAKSNVVVSCEKVVPETSSFEDGRWYVAMDRVVCGSIAVKGSAHLILADGANLTVRGGENSAGIDVSSGRSLVVYGQFGGTGELVANGGKWAAGIGGGKNCAGGAVTLHRGRVAATGGQEAAGIGGGAGNDGGGGEVRIDGGAFDIRGGTGAENAIGPGNGGTGGTISISGGIFASKIGTNWLAPGRFCVANTDSQTSAKYPWKVVEGVPVRFVRGLGVTALQYRIEGGGVYVPFPDDGAKLSPGSAIDLQVQTAPGFVYQGPTHFTVGELGLTETISAGAPYINEKGETCVTDGALTLVSGATTAFDAGWYVVTGRVECGTITVNGEVRLVLADGCSLTVDGGIRVESGRALTIYGQSEGTGELKAIGASRCAGIGAGPSGNSGTVAIHCGKIDACAGDGAKDDIGAGGGGTAGPVTITGGFFARKPKEAWIAEGHWISGNCQPGTSVDYSWRVLKFAWVPVRLNKGTGVDEFEFRRENEDEFEPFPAGGTNLLVGAWVRICVHSKPGYVYTGDVWFCVAASGLTRTIASTEVKTDGDGSPERPWFVGDSAVAWTNGIGGLSVSGEGPMDDCIDAYGPIWMAFADDITELTVDRDVTAIGAGAFAGLTNLKKVKVTADRLDTVGDYAFADCWSLADLTLPNSVEEIGESAFEYCFDLRSCDLPASLRTIGARAFFYCWTLTELDIPDSVVEIGDQAFAGCSWIERLGLGSGLVWLGDSAFSDCTSIRTIAIRAEEPPFVGDKVFHFVPSSATLTVPAASVDLYKMAAGWRDFDVQPTADPSNEADLGVVARPTLAARRASAAFGAVNDKPAFEVVREGSVVRVTVRLPKALPGVLYRLMGSADLTFAEPTEVVRGTAVGTGGLELSGMVPEGAECYFRVDVEGGNAQ